MISVNDNRIAKPAVLIAGGFMLAASLMLSGCSQTLSDTNNGTDANAASDNAGNAITEGETGNDSSSEDSSDAIVSSSDKAGVCSSNISTEVNQANGCDGVSDGSHGYDVPDGWNNMLVSSDVDDVIDSINNNDTFIAVFGYSSCPDCRIAIPAFLEKTYQYDKDSEKIKYIDTRANPSWTSNMDIDDYDKLVALVGDRFTKDEDGKAHMQVPFIMFVNNGLITNTIEGFEGIQQTDDTEELTDELKDEYAEAISEWMNF